MKVLIAMLVFYLSGLGIICMIKGSIQSGESSVQRQHLENFSNVRTPVSEVYVISLHESKFNVFTQRNFDLESDDDEVNDVGDRHKNFAASSFEWFEGYNGMDQSVLDEFSKVTGLWTVNASMFNMGNIKDAYASPHAVGCYLSHWRRLEKVRKKWKDRKVRSNEHLRTGTQQQKPPHRPDMLFVFEDDANCVSNLIERTWNTVRQLPKDWDILYIGGKPVSYYTGDKTLAELSTAKADPSLNITRPSDDQLLNDMCSGKYGTSPSGPFAPGTTVANSVVEATAATWETDPPYWHTKYILNTNAYVINPKRIKRVLRLLSSPQNDYKPIDVRLAADYWRDFMDPYSYQNSVNSTNAPLKSYLTSHMFCDQEVKRTVFNRDQPVNWEGYHWLPYKISTGWPDVMGFVWSTQAHRTTCARILNTTKQST